MIMSHRLQHLQKRRVEPYEYSSSQQQQTHQVNTYQKQQKSELSHLLTRPIFPPSKTKKTYDRNAYKSGDHPFPPPQCLYRINSSQLDPSFFRATSSALYNLPKKSNIPISAWITPFSNPKVHIVNLRAPLRCPRCKAYINKYFQLNGNQSATCNLCGNLFNIQQAVDRINMNSAEIATQAVIDFRVSDRIYLKKRTDIIKVFIVIEMSMQMIELKVVQTVISSLRKYFESEGFESKIRFAFVVYGDQGVGFLRKPNGSQEPTLFFVPNNKFNMFSCPLSDEEMMIDPIQKIFSILQILNFIQAYSEGLWKQGKFTHRSNYANAIRCIKSSFDNETGRILLFSCLDPKEGACSITYRNEQEQKLPLKPLHMEFHELANELLRIRIGVDHFYFSKDTLFLHQLATTHYLSSKTGGQILLFGGYNNQVHSNRLYNTIYHLLTRPTYYNLDFICRTSPGLSVLRYGTPSGLQEDRDIPLCIANNSSSYTVQIVQDDKLQVSKGAFVQFAVIYTTGSGQRRLRVINYKFKVSQRLEDIYDSLDYLTFAKIVARSFTTRLITTSPAKIREDAFKWISEIIKEYRSCCTRQRVVKLNGFSVPQRLTWSLCYLHSILNGKLFFNYNNTADLKIYEYLKLHQSNPYFFASKYYPHVYPLTLDIYDSQPFPGDFLEFDEDQQQNEESIAILPKNLVLTKGAFINQGVYLYEALDQIIIFVQSNVSEELMYELFGTTDLQQIEYQQLPELETSHNIRVHNILSEIRRRNSQHGGMHLPVCIRTTLKKGPFSDLFHSLLKENYYDCNFDLFIKAIKNGVEPGKERQ